MQDFSALEGKTLSELREIGKVLGITDTTLRKKELLEKITQVAMAGADDAPQAEPQAVEQSPEALGDMPKKRGRRPRMSSMRIEENKPAGDSARVASEGVAAESA